jgi:hypothetical protein
MKRLVYESLNEFISAVAKDKDIIKGQKKIGLTVEDVDSKEFLVGMEVEKEHSSDLSVVETIVLQHLADNEKYYSEGMKKGIFEEPAAINLYKKYFIDKEEPEEKQETAAPTAPATDKGPDLGGMGL